MAYGWESVGARRIEMLSECVCINRAASADSVSQTREHIHSAAQHESFCSGNMVSESLVRSRASGHKKVSKPLMEKKRRARINTCLDQLKTLLESLYSSNIRKRKLEKADILELTVKHLKHLQKTEKGFPLNSGVAEYQAGYASCLASVNQYLLMSDADAACRSGMLAQMTRSLPRLGAPLPDFSTADSDSSRALPARRGRNHSGESKRTEICEHQTPAHGLLDQPKHAHANRSRDAPTALQPNYWRPW